ncbi:MAG: MBL fold metallo-hydrolase [Nitrososphaerota archaeon]|nr:MBL fold metallo-hydrolase [Nitrososphaerota archaeon]
MTPAAVSFRIGDARVTSFDVGDLSLRLDEVFGPSSVNARYFGGRDLTVPEAFPTKSFFVASGPLMVVVDPSDYGRLLSPDHFKTRAGYVSPPPLEVQLAAAGVAPESVTHVVVTHLHFDHYAGVTKGGAPAFPSARYIIPAKDWATPEVAEARKRGDADVAQTLGVVEAAGKLEPLDGPLGLGGGLTVEPYPGETPGHQVVGVRSGSESCYLVGDLYHLAEEVEHPELAAAWADAGALAASRRRFSERAAAERALVIPGHLPAGRISFKGSFPTWTEEPA